MKRVISLLNIVLALGLVVTASVPPVPLAALGGVVDDGSSASRAPYPRAGEVPTLEKKASVQALPSYMELVFASDSGGTWDIWKDTIQDIDLLTSDPVGAHTPRAAPGGGRVAFVSDRNGNPEIYVVDYDGTNERRLTYNEHDDSSPSWSPSGNRLVFSSDRDGDDHEIYIMDVDGSYVARLTYNDDWDSWPVYSPDGTEIAFTTRSPLGDYDIWIMNADGSQQRALIANPAVDEYLPAWFPDGTEIAFTMWDPLVGDDEIWEFTLANGLIANLTNTPTSNDWAPVVSPDGAWIAFFSGRTGDDEVWVMPTVGGAGNETNISSDPAADDRFPDFSWARMSVKSGAWEQASTWLPNGVPGQRDRVLIRQGDRVTITSGEKKVVRQLQVNGDLLGNCAVRVAAPWGITVGSTGRILAGQDSYLKKGCKVFLDAWPDGTITVDNGGQVFGGNGAGAPLDPAWAEDGGPVELLAKNITIDGDVWGGRGGDLGRHWRDRAGGGGNVTMAGEYITINPTGLVFGGRGGNTNPDFVSPRDASNCPTHRQDGGKGGSVFLGGGTLVSYGGTRELTVWGRVWAGDGGDVTGRHPGRTGSGGDVQLSVQWATGGKLDVKTGAVAAGGNGGLFTGNAVDCTDCCVCGGNGGDVFKFASLSVTLAGNLLGGARGDGRAVPRCQCECGPGFRGSVTNHPPTITFASTAQESGRNVWIYGGDGWGIDLSQVQHGAITATESITVAVGSGGQIDLRGHGAGESILSADQGIFFYADSGQILLDPGVSVADLTDPPAQVAPARVIYRGVLHAEGDTSVLAGASAVISLTLTNAGGGADTFQLAAADTGGWSWQLSPGSLSLESMAEGVIVAMADVPPETVGLLNEVTFSAQSTADPSQMAVVNLVLKVVEVGDVIYLPVVLRNYSPPPLYFDDFGDPSSGWPISDRSDYALDYDGGNYRIQLKQDNWAAWTWPGFACADCTIEVEAWRSTGANSRYAIAFGLNSSGSQSYFFQVQPGRREYCLRRYDEGTWVMLIPYTYSSYINGDDSHNRLRVTREGSQIKLYVNDHYLASYTDSTYSGTRRVGIYGGSGSTSPVSLRYDDFTVWGAGYGTTSATEGDSCSVGVTDAPPD